MTMELAIPVSQEDFHDWKNHPVTEQFFSHIETIKKEWTDFITQGRTLEREFSEQLTARYVGGITTLEIILNLTIENEES